MVNPQSDWSFRDKSKILSKLKREAHENAIILCHDTVTETCQIADEMIAWLLKEGYTIITVGELLRLRWGEIEPGRQYNRGAPRR